MYSADLCCSTVRPRLSVTSPVIRNTALTLTLLLLLLLCWPMVEFEILTISIGPSHPARDNNIIIQVIEFLGEFPQIIIRSFNVSPAVKIKNRKFLTHEFIGSDLKHQ